MAFSVLLVALIPLAYLFTTAVIQAGQSDNQLAGLSIAEGWAETLSNTTPPVNFSTGAVIVDTSEPPSGPAPTFSATVTGSSLGSALNAVSVIHLNSTASFALASAAVPQVANVTTGSGASTLVVPISYTSTAGNTLTCATNPCSSATGTMSGAVTQAEIATPTETRGGTTYKISSEYEWETAQNTGIVTTTYSGGSNLSLPLGGANLPVTSVTNFLPATPSSPQTAKVVTQSNGLQTIFYTGIQTSPSLALTGVTGGTGTVLPNARVKQNPKPNLCTAGTPQLLKVTVTVSWGPNADQNQVQDSVILNYPPFGVQTLGFIALQFAGDSLAADSQMNPWSERVTAIPVQFSGPQVLNLYPDAYGCVFAQVLPGNYSVTVGQPAANVPPGSTYGSPQFVANAVGGASTPAGTYTGNVWSPPTSEPVGTVPTLTVNVGAVTRVQGIAPSNYPPFDQASTLALNYPSSTAVQDGASCPGAGQITCITSGPSSAGSEQISWTNGSTWSSPSLPGGVALTRLTWVSCAGSGACIGVGYGPNGVVILHAATSPPALTAYSMTALAGLNASGATLTQVSCPSATQCVAIGTTNTGAGVVLSGTIGTSAATDSWVADTLPTTTTSLSSLQCPVGATGCVALATTSSTPVIVSGPTAGPGAWASWTTPGSGPTSFTVSALSQLVCPSTTTCLATGVGRVNGAASGPVVLSGAAGGSGFAVAVPWIADSVPGTTLTSLSSITCPVPGKCLVAGTGTSGSTTGAFFLYGPTAGPMGTEFPLKSSATVTALSSVTCPAAGNCVAIGNQTGTPVIFSVVVNAPATADTFTADTVPSGSGSVASLNGLVCPAASACLISGTGTVAGNPVGLLIDSGAVAGSGTTWSTASLPSTDNVLYFDGIDCTSGPSGTCTAVGATPTGAVILSSGGGPTGSWSDGTPPGLTGYATQGVPVEINNSLLASGITSNHTYVTAVTAGSVTNVTLLPLVFPFSNGYNLFAGDCPSEGSNAYALNQAATIPGGIAGSTSGMAPTTIPLGVLSISVASPGTGLPHPGVTLTLKSTPSAGCGTDSYTLQTSAVDGSSRTEVPFGSYSLYLNGSSTAYGTLVVSANSVVLSGATLGNGTYVLPGPVGVVG